MPTVAVRAVATGEEAAAVHAIVLAFSADPVARWCWPDPHQYLTHMPPFVRAFAGAAFPHGGAYSTDDHAGAALWLLPSAHPDAAAMGDLMERTLTPAVRGDLTGAMARLAACHPAEPHWYLPMIGVDPAHQGRGLGAALLTHTLRLCDRDRRIAYLESTNPRNVSLYERHGFRAVDRVQVGGSPTFTPMVRPAR